MLYKVIRDPSEQIKEDKKLRLGNYVSFTTNPHHHGEFGSWIVGVNYDKFCKKYKCTEVVYEFSWMTEHPEILLSVTGMDENEWMEWARDDYSKFYGDPTNVDLSSRITEEIDNLYSWENEVIVEGDPVEIDLKDIMIFEKYDDTKHYRGTFMSNGIGKGWHFESANHALASRGIRIR